MGEQQGSEFYDKLWSNPGFSKPARELRWWKLWENTAKAIKKIARKTTKVRVIDLGCGPAHLLEALSITRNMAYVGYDFSPVAIGAARARGIERSEFHVADLERHDFNETIQAGETVIYVANEFLEHVSFDLEVIRHMRICAPVIFSLPKFDDPGHAWFVIDESDIVDRYDDLLTFHSMEWVDEWRCLSVALKK